MAGTIKTDVELYSQVQAGIRVNGNREITPPIDKSIRDNVIASKLSIKDGGNIIQALTGYSSELTLSDRKNFVYKGYVDDSISSAVSSIDFSPYLNKDGSVTLEEDLPILDTKGFVWASTSEIRDNGGFINISAFNGIKSNSDHYFNSNAYFDFGLDTTATVGTDTLNIGGTNADVINIGRTGKAVNILGTLNGYLSNTLTSAQIFVGNGSNVATGVSLSGDASLVNSGAFTVTGIQGKSISLATGFLKYTGSAWAFDNSTYLTGNQTITLSGDISGSGSTSITTTIGAGKVTNSMLAGSIDYTKLDSTTSASFKSFAISGTGGNGYGEFIAQSSAPSAPSSAGLRLFAGSTGNLSWMRNDGGTDTFRRTFSSTLTANRTYTFQDNTYTLAGIDIAQSWTAKQTFTGSTTEMASVSLLDTTYKTGLDVSAANAIRLGNGFTTVKLQPGGGNAFSFSGSTISVTNSGGSVIGCTWSSGDISFGFNRFLVTTTINGTSLGNYVFGYTGTISSSSSGTGGVYSATPTINATTSAPISLFNADPSAYTALAGDLYGYRSNIASGTGRYNIRVTGTAPSKFDSPNIYPSYSVTQANALTAAGGKVEGAVIYVNNESGGKVMAFFDGTNWLRVTDRAIIS